MPDELNPVQADSPEAHRYNRIRRWLGVTDFMVGFAFLIVLLVTGWSDWLRDLAYRLGFQNYSLSLFMYLVLLLVIGKALGIGLDYYGFSLERRFKLSTQRFRSWVWDEAKGFPGRTGDGNRGGRSAVLHAPAMAAALVDPGLGAVHGPVHRYGATCAGGAVPHLLQVRTAGQRRPAAAIGGAERARRNAGARESIAGSFRRKARRRMRRSPDWARRAASFWPTRCSTTTRRKRSKRCWRTNSGTTCIATF